MEDNKKIISRLDSIIILLLFVLQGKEMSPKLPAIFNQLKKVGLTNEEIADIFNKTPSQVAKTAYEFKRPTKKSIKR